MRKIIQIALSTSKDNIPTIAALCDDNTVWAIVPEHQAGWERCIPIPQDNDKDRPARDDLGKF